MNRRRNTFIAIGAIALVAILGIAFHRDPSPVAVRELTVHYADFQTKLPESGVVELPQTVTLPAYVAGNLGSILVRAGDHVGNGQLLATIVNDQIASNVADSQDAAASAQGKAQSVAEINAALPSQNRSSVLQAEAAVVAARSQLTQAEQDRVAGSQSGLGYGGSTAEEQRLEADSTLAKAQTDFDEAQRTYTADENLYGQKAVSHDQLLQSQAKLNEARVTLDQARRERGILGGQLTREGDVLRDRVRSARDGLLQAQAALASAKADAAESKAGDLAAAQADANHADADLAYARDQASKLRITAPFDGIIQSVAAQSGDSLRPLQPGDAIALGQAIFTIAGGSSFIVRTKVDEQDIASVRTGQRAVISGEDFDGATIGGRVASISPVAQKSDDPSNTSRQVLTTIALDRRLPFLRDGMTVDVDIVTHDQKHVISIPTDAVRKDDKGSYVLAIRDGRAKRVAVTLGAQSDTDSVVTSGLSNGDRIVAEKNAEVSPDTAVTAAASAAPVTTSATPE